MWNMKVSKGITFDKGCSRKSRKIFEFQRTLQYLRATCTLTAQAVLQGTPCPYSALLLNIRDTMSTCRTAVYFVDSPSHSHSPLRR